MVPIKLGLFELGEGFVRNHYIFPAENREAEQAHVALQGDTLELEKEITVSSRGGRLAVPPSQQHHLVEAIEAAAGKVGDRCSVREDGTTAR